MTATVNLNRIGLKAPARHDTASALEALQPQGAGSHGGGLPEPRRIQRIKGLRRAALGTPRPHGVSFAMGEAFVPLPQIQAQDLH